MLTDEDITLQKEKDSRVLDLLRLCMSDMGREHTLEHFFYAPAFQTAQAMAQEAKESGYKTSNNHYVYKGRDVWSVVVFSPVLPNDEAVNNESIFMLSLARKHGADYDGWGTGMVGDGVSLKELEDHP